MKKLVAFVFAALLPVTTFGASTGGPALPYIEVNLSDTHSLQNGAKLFVNYCLGCHSAEYMRYNRLSEDLHIPAELVERDMIFSDAKIGDTMDAVMPEKKAAEWFGVAPPDLTLTGRLRDANWIYGYLTGFYVDESTESGWNNTVFSNVAMPHVLADLQGRQRAVFTEGDNNEAKFERFELESAGSMTTEEFNSAMQDLTNFMVYMGEPAKLKRIKYGMYVMLFLFIFAALAYLLKKEYWRDVDVTH